MEMCELEFCIHYRCSPYLKKVNSMLNLGMKVRRYQIFAKVDFFFFNIMGRIVTVYHYTGNGQAYVFSVLYTSLWNIPGNAFGVIFVFLSL